VILPKLHGELINCRRSLRSGGTIAALLASEQQVRTTAQRVRVIRSQDPG
jgi:hypothetical protein